MISCGNLALKFVIHGNLALNCQVIIDEALSDRHRLGMGTAILEETHKMRRAGFLGVKPNSFYTHNLFYLKK